MSRHARVGSYGIDEPLALMCHLLSGLVLVSNLIPVWRGTADLDRSTILFVVAGGVLILLAAMHLHTTVRGRFVAWSQVLDGLGLRGDERVLDLGFRRGEVLVLVARRLGTGRAVGIDVPRRFGRRGNAVDLAVANAHAEGVAERVDLWNGHLFALPFRDGVFDVVVSSRALHDIPPEEGRTAALAEVLRVLRPGGGSRWSTTGTRAATSARWNAPAPPWRSAGEVWDGGSGTRDDRLS